MPLPRTCATTVAACLALLSCREPAKEGEPANAAAEQPVQPAPLTVAERPLDREALLLAALRAASAFSAGSDDSETQAKLDGKRFELRIRFGCANGTDEARGWRFDEANRTLRLRVTPDISEADPVAAEIAGEQFETVEGLWLRRPWLLTATCPADSLPAGGEAGEAIDKSEPTASGAAARMVGLAQFFSPTDSRTTRRRQRPYEATKILEEGQAPSAKGYDFVLSGRLRALPSRRVIACLAKAPEEPPACIISVHVDRAWLERPDNRELIAEWGG